MKTLYYMGRNARNISGVSWKIWKIEQRGRDVTVWWAPANIVKRRPTPTGKFQTKTRRFRTEAQAKAFEEQRIQDKLSAGYEKTVRRRAD